jgi:hypothetical protein
VKILDTNLLLYAVNEDAPSHAQARIWLEGVLNGSETVGFAWVVLLAFVRLSTRSAVFPRSLAPEAALDQVETWLAQPCSTVVQPGEKHLRVLRDLIQPLGTGGNLTSDVHLAALAIEHGAELCSCDADFSRFPGLRWRNPLSDRGVRK